MVEPTHRAATVAITTLLACGAACSSPPPVPAPTSAGAQTTAVAEATAATPLPAPDGPEGYAALRGEVGKLVTAHCASCHTASSKEAKPAALAVFDLDREDWPSTLEPGQHEGFRKRFASHADDEKHRQIEAFLAALLARSGGAAAP